jgi:hypothetical protein
MNLRNLISRFKGRQELKLPSSNRDGFIDSLPKGGVCAEIGVWKGDLSARILSIAQPRELHLIDPWMYQTGFGERLFGGAVAKSQEDMDGIFESVKSRFKEIDLIKIHRGFSNEVAPQLQNEMFDWVYVDGNHYYDYVLEDLNLYFPKVKRGGLLVGDDYMWTSPELNGDRPVKRAIQDFITENNGAELVGEPSGGQFIIKKV